MAAGFTVRRENIPAFREAVTAMAMEYRENHPEGTALELDCSIPPELLTVPNVAELDALEPFGAGCARPQFYMDGLRVEQLSEVGGGKHLKLRLSRSGKTLGGIFFSTTACRAAIAPGDLVEAAFTPQVNEFRGMRTVQLNLTDIRPAAECPAGHGTGAGHICPVPGRCAHGWRGHRADSAPTGVCCSVAVSLRQCPGGRLNG